LDLVLGTILALAALPVILVLAVGVAASLRAWPFFTHTRPGWQGRAVRIVKLRTLPPSTPRYADKHTLGLAEMPLPWLCGVLRRTHLDELPQLFSVVLGHMSLVGPRPQLPHDVEPIEMSYDRLRRQVRPGCTGLWQLSVASSDTATSAPRFDVFYIERASIRLDLWIIGRTVGWILGLVRPIDVADIPQWLCGPGLLDRAVTSVAVAAEPVEQEAISAAPFLPAAQRQPDGLEATGEPLVAAVEVAGRLYPADALPRVGEAEPVVPDSTVPVSS
jgi:lipopolysaccharide/colanic/teichoic acid biosynthesis glycosyltransferase